MVEQQGKGHPRLSAHRHGDAGGDGAAPGAGHEVLAVRDFQPQHKPLPKVSLPDKDVLRHQFRGGRRRDALLVRDNRHQDDRAFWRHGRDGRGARERGDGGVRVLRPSGRAVLGRPRLQREPYNAAVRLLRAIPGRVLELHPGADRVHEDHLRLQLHRHGGRRVGVHGHHVCRRGREQPGVHLSEPADEAGQVLPVRGGERDVRNALRPGRGAAV